MSSNTARLDPAGERPGAIRPEEFSELERVLREVVRASGVSADDAPDFCQYVHLRLLETDYDALSRFRGQSSFRTYLRRILLRMLFDWRRILHGTWRPSAAARKLGGHGTQLDGLLYRDRLSIDEAVQVVGMQPQAPAVSDLREIARRLPPHARRRFVPMEGLVDQRAVPFDDPIEQHERREAVRRRSRVLADALGQLSSRDRMIVTLRYSRNKRLTEAALSLRLDPRALYRRHSAVLRRLRQQLETAGIRDGGRAS